MACFVLKFSVDVDVSKEDLARVKCKCFIWDSYSCLPFTWGNQLAHSLCWWHTRSLKLYTLFCIYLIHLLEMPGSVRKTSTTQSYFHWEILFENVGLPFNCFGIFLFGQTKLISVAIYISTKISGLICLFAYNFPQNDCVIIISVVQRNLTIKYWKRKLTSM